MDFESFKNKFQKEPVKEVPNEIIDSPIVSVCVQTYQHSNYIKQCLEGILMQKTNFSFEILLGEDQSTDGTREICLEYAKKYPEKIRLFLHHRKNNIFIGGNPTGRFNFSYNLYTARGKYIALCEGDDYWTEPLKLQKQVDFLEENEEYAVCEHVVGEVNQHQKTIKRIPDIEKNENRSINQYIKTNYGATCSLVFRRVALNESFFKKIHLFPFGDWPLKLHLLKNSNGKSMILKDVMGVYRLHSDSVHGSLRLKNNGLIDAYKQHLTFIKLLRKYLLPEKEYRLAILDKEIEIITALLKQLNNPKYHSLYNIRLNYLKIFCRFKQ